MLDLDSWQEIFDTISQNKLRTVLTGFSVAWGIFMLIILLGSGNGLANNVHHEFRDDAVNSLWIRSGQTSQAYKGMRPGRYVHFTNEDHDAIRRDIDGAEHMTSRFRIRGPVNVSYNGESGSYRVRCVHPGHRHLEKTIMTEGRFINELDVRNHRKAVVIGTLVEQALFGDESAIGKQLQINGIAFTVVGVFEDVGSEGEMEVVYLPISTAQRTFNGANRVHQIMFTTGDATVDATKGMETEVRELLATRHVFGVDDKRAVSIRNNLARFERFMGVINNIRSFVWVVGFGTVIAGMVGVGNIMLITVRERTREFGIRKALGASPWSIVRMVLQESVLITGVAGYVGLVLGVATLEFVGARLPEDTFFRNPEVDLTIAGYATVLLVLAGAIAGLFPARQAARIRPIAALRDG